jgi:hypothetical protein
MGQRWLVRRERFDLADSAAVVRLSLPSRDEAQMFFLFFRDINNLLYEVAATSGLVTATSRLVTVIKIDPSKLAKAIQNPGISSQKVTDDTF